MSELPPPTHDLIERARELADEMGHTFVGTEHLLFAMVKADENIAAHRILDETGSLSAVAEQLTKMFGCLPR
jgi:ATP-dependent Clp protease ATP-binding subunit ClpA